MHCTTLFYKKKYLTCILIGLIAYTSKAQLNTSIVKDSSIATAMLFPYNNQTALPIIKLNSGEQLELHFDDLNGGYKIYNYTYQLCNADWTPALVTYYDYLKGFTNNRISNYRISSIANKKYTHYQAYLPEKNCMPTKSGNYMLKVYADGDTSKLLFTKQMMVYEDRTTVGAQIIQPLNANTYRTNQRILAKVNTQALNINNVQQQIKIVVLQNNRWDMAMQNILPTFIRGKDIEYNNENDFQFAGGREWRWADLRSFRFWTDRVLKGEQLKTGNTIQLKPDGVRNALRYFFYRDFNGMYFMDNTDNINAYTQGDYAKVTFNFVPPNGQVFNKGSLHVIGAMNNYEINDKSKLTYNATTKLYETTLLLKQAYYSYQYVLVTKNGAATISNINETEGSYWETENSYQILVYYKNFGTRADELVGYTSLNSLNGRSPL